MACLAAAGVLAAQPAPPAPAVLCPGASLLAEGIELIPGRFVQGAQPDGNSVVLRAPAGLIVIDTGRHAEHTRSVLDCAARRSLPIAAVINTHWHLDHIGGNPLVREAFPQVRIWASGALAQAQVGFLADHREQLVEAIAASQDPAARSSWETELSLIDAGPALAPDEVVAAAGPRTIAGRPLEIGFQRHAVTAGDLWVLDPATGVLAAGDLVTLPAPLLDTACPSGWQAALDRVATVDFEILVPGHGPPMTRDEFEVYRSGFAALRACAASGRTDQACIDGWLHGLGALVPEGDRDLARALLQYYLPSSLRATPGTLDRWCAGP
jgi:glyoxylase-like metal-dependent hydrolase (beta-lactamase superfamily II)